MNNINFVSWGVGVCFGVGGLKELVFGLLIIIELGIFIFVIGMFK